MSIEELSSIPGPDPTRGEPAAARVAPLTVGPDEAAKVLGTTRSNVYDLLKSGELRSFRLGKRRLIAVAELERFVDRMDRTGGIRRVAPAPPAR